MYGRNIIVNIESIYKVKRDIYLLSFSSPYLVKNSSPGQFVHLKIKDTILRRPFSINRVFGNRVYILFKVKGKGTKSLASYKKGDRLDVLGPLGRGFRIYSSVNNAVNIIIGAGIGIAPLLFLAQRIKRSKDNYVFIGARNKNGIICAWDFRNLGWKLKYSTDDGSRGYKGTVVELFKKNLSIFKQKRVFIYACGPYEMAREISKVTKGNQQIKAQFSFDQFMGCGLGICCACVIVTKSGYRKVCKEGPVFDLQEVF